MKSFPFWALAFLIVFSTFAVFSIVAYNKMAERIGDLQRDVSKHHSMVQDLQGRLKNLETAVSRSQQDRSAQAPAAVQEVIRPVANRVAELEKKLDDAVAKYAAAPAARPETPPAPDGQKPLENQVKEAVRKELSERDKARNERTRQNLQNQGVELISKRIPSLTEQQKETLSPVLGDHAFRLYEMWGGGGAVDENGKPISDEERNRRSDQIRAELTEKVKAHLTPSQQIELDAWVLERRGKKYSEREGQWAWQWLFY